MSVEIGAQSAILKLSDWEATAEIIAVLPRKMGELVLLHAPLYGQTIVLCTSVLKKAVTLKLK